MKVTQNELKSGVITLLLTIALGVLLVCCTLHYEYPPKGMEELAQAPSMNAASARAVYDFFHASGPSQ